MMHVAHNRPSLGLDELQALTKVLASGQLIAGEEVLAFENAVKNYIKTPFAVAVTSGHAGLHLSLVVLGLGAEDEVIVPSYTVSDVLNAILYIGARPVVVDIQEDAFSIDPAQVAQKITKKTKAIVVPHMLGMPAKIEEIRTFGVPVIEDSAQSLGCTYHNKFLGAFGDLNMFSFYATKIVTTGQGGMVTTSNETYYNALRDLLNYNAPREYIVRYNYELTDIAASMGRVQLSKLPSFLLRRKKITQQYQECLQLKNVAFYPRRDMDTNYFRFILEFPTQEERDLIKMQLQEKGISTIIPLKPYEALHTILGLPDKDFMHTYQKTTTTLSLPLYPSLTEEEVAYITDTLEEIL